MAQKTLIHKGYNGSIEVDTRDYSLYGRILFIGEQIPYSAQSFTELEERFRQAVERHIADCRARGEEPPFTE